MDTFNVPPIDEFPWDNLMQFVAEPMDVDSSATSRCQSAVANAKYTKHAPGQLVADKSVPARPIATPLATPQLPTPPDSDVGSGSPEEEGRRASANAHYDMAQEAPSYVSVSTTFYPGSQDDPATSDIVLLSDDSVWFYVDSSKLYRASDNNFNGLLPSRSPRHDQPDFNVDPITSVPASSRVLNILLHAIYNMSPANYHPSFTDLSTAALLIPVYGISAPAALADSPPSPLYSLLASHAQQYPLDLYILAAQLDLHPLASHASQYLHSLSLSGISDEQACGIGPIYLKRLFFLHYGRADALKRILVAPPQQHSPTKHCDYLDQRGLTRAWALASAYLAWDSRADLSTSTIESALMPLSNQLTCELCREVLQERIKKLLEDWNAIKRTI